MKCSEATITSMLEGVKSNGANKWVALLPSKITVTRQPSMKPLIRRLTGVRWQQVLIN